MRVNVNYSTDNFIKNCADESIYLKKTVEESKQKYIRKEQIILSTFLRESRKSCGYSQDDVAHGTGIHRNTISRIERGFDFKLCDLIILSDFYGVNISERLYGL